MRSIFAISAVCFATILAVATSAFVPTSAFAQQGTLQGGRLVLNSGTNTVTLLPAAATTSYSLTLPTANTSLVQYLANDGAGNLFWGIPAATSSTGVALYNTGTSQPFNEPSTGGVYTIDIGYSGTGTAAGALINVVANGPSNTTINGLLDTARNIYTGKVTWSTGGQTNNGQPDEIAGSDTASLAASPATGTAIGVEVSATGGGYNYAAITKGGSVCIGVAPSNTPTDSLEVNGNVLISGQNGLKIQEGTNACMGVATLTGTTAVPISTNEVTTTSRILLTTQSPSGTVGTPYVSAQSAGSFSIKSTSGSDASTVAWLVLLP